MKTKKKLKFTALFIALTMIFSYSTTTIFAVENTLSDLKTEATDTTPNESLTTTKEEGIQAQVPRLKEGVSATQEDTVIVGSSYIFLDLQNNKIFENYDGTNLNYTCYYYERSSDGGETWSKKTNFPESLFGSTPIQVIEQEIGTYIYKFYASNDNGQTFSTDTWTFTLNVVESINYNIAFNVGRDYQYNTTQKYPVIKIFKTAGIDSEGHDYVGYYEKAGEKIYVYEPDDFTITKDEAIYKITDNDGTYTLNDYEPVEFTNSLFGKDGENPLESGALDNNYAKYFVSIPNGRYSYRSYSYNTSTEKYDIDLGGMSLSIPIDENVSGSSNSTSTITLRCISLYSNTKLGENYLDENAYYTDILASSMNCHPIVGDHYKNGNFTYYPYMLYAAGNSCTYNYYAYGKEGYQLPEGYLGWSPCSLINRTISAGYGNMNTNMTLKATQLATYTIPANCKLELFFQNANFNTIALSVANGYPITNEDNTITYGFAVDTTLSKTAQANYSWRLTDTTGEHVTIAGYTYPDSDLTNIYDTYNYKNKHYHDFDLLQKSVVDSEEADINSGISPTGFKTVDAGKSLRVRFYRMWEIVNSLTANIMIEPNFNYQILQGSTSEFNKINAGNASSNWIDIDPNKTVIGAVNYDAIYAISTTNMGGLFPATNPERTSVFIVSDEAEGVATANIPRNGLDDDKTRSKAWDYNYDTWHYNSANENPELYFTVKDAQKVEYAIVTTNEELQSTMSSWNQIQPTDEKYTVDLKQFRNAGTKGGTVIIRMTDASGNYSYQNVKVAEFSVSIENIANPGEEIMPGTTVEVSVDGLYRGLQKMSGIFNPQKAYLRYENNGTIFEGDTQSQYGKMDKATLTIAIPKDLEMPENSESAKFTLTNGRTYSTMYSDAKAFSSIYNMTDNGIGANFNAITAYYTLGHHDDINIDVQKGVVYKTNFDIICDGKAVEDYNLTIKKPNGDIVTPNEDGSYNLIFNEYTYELSGPTVVRKLGSFRLGSATENENGKVTYKIEAMPSHADKHPWDGVSATEPTKDENDVYQIGTAAELAWFANTVNGGNRNINAVLIDDIELAGFEWDPIGTNTTKSYIGSFDGQGHNIYNMVINYTTEKKQTIYKGLFAYVTNANISNFKIHGDINASGLVEAKVGGATAYVQNSTLKNITSYVNINIDSTYNSYSNSIGGVLGTIMNNGTIENCVNYGNITGPSYVGGIVGAAGNNRSFVTIKNCVNHGDITAKLSNAGGIAGSSNYSEIIGCLNKGQINCSNNRVGGITAYSYEIKITESSNYGKATGLKSVAGIVGELDGTNSLIESCYNVGEITAQDTAGGIVASLAGTTTINKCYTIGAVNKMEGANNATIGSTIGTTTGTSIVITNTYALEGICDNLIGTNSNNYEISTATASEVADGTLKAKLGDPFIQRDKIDNHPILMATLNNTEDDLTITFDADNESEKVVKLIKKGFELDFMPEAPAKEGYVFIGWFKDVDDINTEYVDGQTYTEDTTYTAKYAHVQMLGAQAKLVVDNKSGIRFGTKIYNDGDEIVEKGTLILPANLTNGEALTLDTPNVAKSIGNVNYEINTKENYVTYLGTIVNMPQSQFERKMTAAAYVIYKDKAGNEYTVYSQYPNKSTSIFALLENSVDWNQNWEE